MAMFSKTKEEKGKKDEHFILAQMSADDRKKAMAKLLNTAVDRSYGDAQKQYEEAYPDVPLPLDTHERDLILGHILNTKGGCLQQSNGLTV